MWKRLKKIFKSQKKRETNKETIERVLGSEFLDKVEDLSSKFHEDDTLVVIVGDHFWNQIPQMWRFDWVRKDVGHGRGLVPQNRTEVEIRGAIIKHDPENKYRFDIESS